MGNWTLIYRTDAEGLTAFGSLDELSRAVLNGADVKVIYSPQQNVWWSRYCSSVNVRRVGGTTVVAATFMEAADTTPAGGGIQFETPFALEYHIYNSTGVRSMMKFGYQDHNLIQDTDNLMPMRWFVKDHQVLTLDSIIGTLGSVFRP